MPKSALAVLVASLGLCSFLAFGPSGSADANPVPTICENLAALLPPVGTTLPENSTLQMLADRSGSTLTLDPKLLQGLILESTYGGSLNCQRNKLFREEQSNKVPVAIPEWFAGGEGALCAADKVRLSAIKSHPLLIDDDENEPTRSDMIFSVQIDSRWSAPCRLTIETKPHYGIIDAYCDGEICAALARIAVELGDADYGGPDPVETSTPSDNATWTKMQQLADNSDLQHERLPTLDKPAETAHRDLDFWNSSIVPVQIDGKILLGIFGTAGFGSHFGSADLFGVYRLAGEHLEPVAGFTLDVVARTLSGHTVASVPSQ